MSVLPTCSHGSLLWPQQEKISITAVTGATTSQRPLGLDNFQKTVCRDLLQRQFSSFFFLITKHFSLSQFFFSLFKKYFSGDFPGGSDGKGSACNEGDPSLIPRSGRFPWGRAWQSTPVFLPGKSHGQWSLEGYSPRDPKESDTTEQLMLSLSRQSNSIIRIYIHSFLYFLFHYGLS